MKLVRIVFAIAVAGPLAASAGEWWGDEPYWKAQPSERPVGYAARATTVRDVPAVDEAPERRPGVAIVESANAGRAALEQVGFPQFNQ